MIEVFDGAVVALGPGDSQGYEGAEEITDATIEFVRKSDGTRWIATWTPDLWQDHPNGAPGRGDALTVTTRTVDGVTTHETEWRPKEHKPWSPELLARLRAEAEMRGGAR